MATSEADEKDWDSFLNLFCALKEKKRVRVLFELFFTADEREMLVKRYRLVKTLLTSDLPQREVSELLNLSISKVTAGSKAVQLLSSEDRKLILKKLEEQH
jgi:Trp operon repressor